MTSKNNQKSGINCNDDLNNAILNIKVDLN